MRLRIAILIATVMLAANMLGMAQSTAAAPAQPFRESGCDAFEFLGDVYEHCWEVKSVSQFNELPSGDTKLTYNGTSTSSLSVNGVVTESATSRDHYVHVFKKGEDQILRDRSTGTYLYTNHEEGVVVTCTFVTDYFYANGEMRHEVSDFVCS
jgi:hypothetical protein